MNRSAITKLMVSAVLTVLLSGVLRAQIVTAAQVNGTWRDSHGCEFRILALGDGKLKVRYDGIYAFKTPDGDDMANMGFAMGTATIDGIVAVFRPNETTGCTITMKFVKGKLVVSQEGSDGDCGFGHNVYAEGTYRRVSKAKPKFTDH